MIGFNDRIVCHAHKRNNGVISLQVAADRYQWKQVFLYILLWSKLFDWMSDQVKYCNCCLLTEGYCYQPTKLTETISVSLYTFLLQEFLNGSYLFWRKASDITVFIDWTMKTKSRCRYTSKKHYKYKSKVHCCNVFAEWLLIDPNWDEHFLKWTAFIPWFFLLSMCDRCRQWRLVAESSI